jgi:uncharacterized Zn finger protein (UPF0148 family)
MNKVAIANVREGAYCSVCGHYPCNCVPIPDFWEKTIKEFEDKRAKRVESIAEEVTSELKKAIAKHKSMNSAHEAYAVILEEVDEFWDEVKAQTLDKAKAKKELLQISAMAQRAILDLGL